MRSRISCPIVLLVFLAGCLPPNEEPLALQEEESFEVMHHSGDEEGDPDLLKVKKLRARKYSFRVSLNLDKDFYLEALDTPPLSLPGIEGIQLATALDITLTITDAFGQIRHIDPICPPVVDPSLNPDIRDNIVRLSPIIEWDRLSDDGELMKGHVDVTIEARLLANHDHRFHEQLASPTIASSIVTMKVKLPKINDGGDDDDHHGNGHGHGHGHH